MTSVDRIKINSLKEIYELERTWKSLEAGTDMTIFQSWDWNLLLFEEEKKRKFSSFFSDIVVYIVQNDSRIILLLPLVIQKHTNKTKWFGRKKGVYILGYGSYSDYLNAVYKDSLPDDKISLLIKTIKNDYPRKKIFFTDLNEDTVFAGFIKKKNAEVINKCVAVYVDLDSSKQEYEKRLSKHVKQNLRTASNRVEKAGYTHRIEIMGKIDNAQLINELMEIHIARMKTKNTNSKDLIHYISSYIRKRYREYRERNNNIISESMKKMDQSYVIISYINNEIVGYLYGLKEKSTIRILQNAFKENYKFYSPMFLGTYEFILEQIESKGIEKIDFTRGGEKYKYDLGGEESILVSYLL